MLPEAQADSDIDTVVSATNEITITADKIELIQLKLNLSQYLSEEEHAIVKRFGMFKQETTQPKAVSYLP